jgi:glycosyltransferase involved in cell wall biosynthesis
MIPPMQVRRSTLRPTSLPNEPTVSAERGGAGRVLYVQYCNPAAYPPIEHSAVLLADAGFDVTLLGTDVPGETMQLRPHPRIQVRIMPAKGAGLRQKLLYARYMMWALILGVRFRPAWIYASDPLSCPVALLLHTILGTQTIYHEHDAPEPEARANLSLAMRAALWARRRLAQTATLCVVPNVQRAELVRQSTGRQDVLSVWNCPMRAEAADAVEAHANGQLKIVYHGSIVPARIPRTVIHALSRLPKEITLTVSGFETLGQFGYSRDLAAEAERLGVGHRVKFVEPIPTRSALLEQCGRFDIGLALFSQQQPEINQQTMAGASNKPFDYMARGLALLVTDLPDWRAMYVDEGFGLCCQPDSVESIVEALKWFWENRAERQAMALRGRQRILEAWNYEQQFHSVLTAVRDASPREM